MKKKEPKNAVIYIRVTASTKKKWEKAIKKYAYSQSEMFEKLIRRVGW